MRGALSALARTGGRRPGAWRGHGGDRRRPDTPAGPRPEAIDEAIRAALEAGQGVREMSEELAARFGCGRRDVYRRALTLRAQRLP